MKSFIKPYIAGLLTALLVFSGTAVFAESSETINAVFGKVKLKIGSTPIAQETLLHNGTTYIPLRSAAEILGMEVLWDNDTRTASLNSAVDNPASSLDSVSVTNTIKEANIPINLDVEVTYLADHPKVPDYGKTYNVELILTSIEPQANMKYYAYKYSPNIKSYMALLEKLGFKKSNNLTISSSALVNDIVFHKDDAVVVIMESKTGAMIGVGKNIPNE